jgi:hypothetical protein
LIWVPLPKIKSFPDFDDIRSGIAAILVGIIEGHVNKTFGINADCSTKASIIDELILTASKSTVHSLERNRYTVVVSTASTP